MHSHSSPGYEALRRYRVSLPGSAYFLTLCTTERRHGLQSPAVVANIKTEVSLLERDGALSFQAGAIMPDHVHLLIVVQGKLTLGRIVGRLKSKSRATLMNHQLTWQGNFFEHRLRSSDRIEDVVRYLFLNPFRGTKAPRCRQQSVFLDELRNCRMVSANARSRSAVS